MSDNESKTLDVTQAEPAKVSTTAPAVHDGRMWGGPQWVKNATEKPVWVETQAEYWRLINRNGFIMESQQESTTGPTQIPAEKPKPLEYSVVVVPPMTQDEAHIFGSITALFKRYGLIETLWCGQCFARNRSHGCRMRVTAREVLLECRCGAARYVPPTGTTDLVLNALANSTVREKDTVSGSVMTDAGPVMRPTTLLNDVEAALLKAYVKACHARDKEPRIFHRECFNGDPRIEAEAVAMSVSSEEVVIVCGCRTLFWRARRSDSIH